MAKSIRNFWIEDRERQQDDGYDDAPSNTTRAPIPPQTFETKKDPALDKPPYARDRFPRWDGCVDCRRIHLRTGDEDAYCAHCRQIRNLPPISVPLPRPWYETMTEEQMAAIRAKRWDGMSGSRPKTAGGEMTLPGRDDTDYTKPTAIKMRYRLADGDGTIDLMVGKIIPHGEYGRVFLHAAESGDGEGQKHDVTDCPCPVDDLLVQKLTDLGIKYFYAYDRDGEVLYRADVADIATAPAAIYAKKTIRTRRFLAADCWRELPKVREALLPDRRTRNLLRGDRLIMAIPWANQEVTLGTDPVAF